MGNSTKKGSYHEEGWTRWGRYKLRVHHELLSALCSSFLLDDVGTGAIAPITRAPVHKLIAILSCKGDGDRTKIWRSSGGLHMELLVCFVLIRRLHVQLLIVPCCRLSFDSWIHLSIQFISILLANWFKFRLVHESSSTQHDQASALFHVVVVELNW